MIAFACFISGRIKAVQLDYSEARRTLVTALRKAPQSTALGFKQTVHTNYRFLFVVVIIFPFSWVGGTARTAIQVHAVNLIELG